MFDFLKNVNYKLKDINTGHLQVTYRGIPAIKCPFDYVLYQMIISSLQPDLVIEIGTNSGGSALYMADLLALNGKGILHTIDLPTNRENDLLHQHPRIQVFKDGYAGYDTSILKGYNTVLVIDDGSHMYEDVLAVLHKFAPLVSVNSYFIAEDGIVTQLGKEKEFHGGPGKAIGEFLNTNKNFIIDRSMCDFFGTNATFNVNGYLKRIS